MPYIVEVDDRGLLIVPPELRRVMQPHSRYVLELQGEVIVLRPEQRQPFWASATPDQRKQAFLEWVANHRQGPGLPDEALRRESFYD
jgi:bifunctional DNA-binding transcriptional regulator/antitoxin component of YhaV-PrlF toxin-antitoxin module